MGSVGRSGHGEPAVPRGELKAAAERYLRDADRVAAAAEAEELVRVCDR